MKETADGTQIVVIDPSGVRGLVQDMSKGESAESVRVVLDDGRDVYLSRDLLLAQTDGSYRVPFLLEQFSTGPDGDTQFTIPVIEETLHVDKRMVEADRVQVVKRVVEDEQTVDVSLLQQSLNVERIPINKVVKSAEKPRKEDNVLIIPIYEERLVVSKQLVMIEAVRITLNSEQVEHSEQHNVRKETVEIRK